jgi:hypothetical protein
MTHLEAKQEILKVDSRGRVQTPPERREALLDKFERSGLSGKRFAEMVLADGTSPGSPQFFRFPVFHNSVS